MKGKDVVFALLFVLLLGFSGFVYTQNLALSTRVSQLEVEVLSETSDTPEALAEDGELPDGVSPEVAAYIQEALDGFSDRLGEGLATRRLVLVNREGQPQILLLTNDEGTAVLTINRPNGQPSVVLGASQDRPAIYVYNSEGEISLSFGEDDARNGEITLYNNFERPVVSLRSGEYNDGEILLGNSNGRNIARMTTSEPGGPGSLRLNRQDGSAFAHLGPTVNGHGMLRLVNADNRLHSIFSADGNGNGLWLLNNDAGETRLRLNVDAADAGRVEVEDAESITGSLPR